MARQLRDEITSGLDEMLQDWPSCRESTKAKISAMQSYYSNSDGQNMDEIVQRSREDEKQLTEDVRKHKKLAANGRNLKRDLEQQVASSEEAVRKLNKHGPTVVVAAALLTATVGAIFGPKANLWAQIVSAIVFGLIGFVFVGIIGVVGYLILKRYRENERNLWHEVAEANAAAVEKVSFIDAKKTCLTGISVLLGGIEVDNMENERNQVLIKMDEYLRDA